MKTRILERWGVRDGHDVQHIEGKRCFRCDGTGEFVHWSGDQDYCEHCGGSGWWKRPAWIVLERRRFGGFVFHIPRERSYAQPKPDVTNIRGYVEHAHYRGREPHIAALWLALLFDRGLFWRLLTGSRPCGRIWHPLLWLNWIAATTVWTWHDCNKRCKCGRRTWSGARFVCRRCANAPSDLPF